MKDIEADGRDGAIEPEKDKFRLQRSRGILVAVPLEPLPTLTDSVVRETLEETRRWASPTR